MGLTGDRLDNEISRCKDMRGRCVMMIRVGRQGAESESLQVPYLLAMDDSITSRHHGNDDSIVFPIPYHSGWDYYA